MGVRSRYLSLSVLKLLYIFTFDFLLSVMVFHGKGV